MPSVLVADCYIRSARNWWLRSPNTNANNERNVNSSGSANNNNANNSNGVAPDYADGEIRVSISRKQGNRTGSERPIPIGRKESRDGGSETVPPMNPD